MRLESKELARVREQEAAEEEAERAAHRSRDE
mgnify:FL=1